MVYIYHSLIADNLCLVYLYQVGYLKCILGVQSQGGADVADLQHDGRRVDLCYLYHVQREALHYVFFFCC